MSPSIAVRILGTGGYLPGAPVTNEQLALRVDTSDEWIRTRTGIGQRYYAADHELTSDLAVVAAERALAAAGLQPSDIDLIVVATSTPDHVFPATACLVQQKLGITRGAAFDLQAVCTGFVYALATANALIKTGCHQRALVIGAEVFSRILNWQDRTTCVLFGDGAGALVIGADPASPSAGADAGILSTHLHADGRFANILNVPGSPDNREPSGIRGSALLAMDGQAVFRQAVKVLEEVAHEALAAHGLSTADVDWFVAHQANQRILTQVSKKLGIASEKVVITVDIHANTSAASIPLALDVAARDGRFQPGQLVLIEGVGGGFTWGAALVRWG